MLSAVSCVGDTLKSQGASIRIGGMKAGWGGEDWLSTLIPRLSRICKQTHFESIKTTSTKNASMVVFFYSPTYLGELVPELIKIGKDLGMDFGAADAVDIS